MPRVGAFANRMAGALRRRSFELRSDVRRHTREILELQIRPRLLERQVAHVHGPDAVDYERNELITICVVRNGASYVRPFVEHYTRLGVAHMVFLDNGSTDGTTERLSAFPHTTVLRTSAPYAKYENAMKLYLARRFSSGRWNLCADIDEMFEYPLSSRLSLRQFLEYLNARAFTAVVAQLLDMFPSIAVASLTEPPAAALEEVHRFYDLSEIKKSDYTWSQASNPAIRMHWGGIRRAAFGTNNGLTKAALVMMDGRVEPFHEWHHAVGARIADISCVLRHYPFTSTFPAKVRDAVAMRRYGGPTGEEYDGYLAALETNPDLVLKGATAREFRGVDALVDEQFLVVSNEYRRWADEHYD